MHIEFLVEEPSIEAFLFNIIPKILILISLMPFGYFKVNRIY